MAKTDPKTMRFDLDVFEYICGFQDGGNFSDNFHAMVRMFRSEETALKQRLSLINKDIADKKKRLDDLNSMLFDSRHLERQFKELQTVIERSKSSLEHFLHKDKM